MANEETNKKLIDYRYQMRNAIVFLNETLCSLVLYDKEDEESRRNIYNVAFGINLLQEIYQNLLQEIYQNLESL